MLTSVSFLTISVLLAVAWLTFLIRKVKKKEVKKEAWKWASQAVSIFISMLLGLSVFSVEQSLSDSVRRSAIEKSMLEEIKIVLEQLDKFKGMPIPPCDSTSNQSEDKLAIYFATLPSNVLKIAIDSNLFKAHIVRHMILLYSYIEEHNRWASYGFDLLRMPDDPMFEQKLRIHNQFFKKIDEQIPLKARLIIDCVTTGTSSLDTDCR